MVADELERRWNVALQKVAEIEERIDREKAGMDVDCVPEPIQFERLASDLDLVWNAPETDIRLKKRILRNLVEEIVVDIDRDAGEITLVIHWKGGVHTELLVRCRRQNSLHTKPEIVEAVTELSSVLP